MALNKNHEFEELNGVKCGIAEKNASPERVTFLKELLEYNGYTVVTAPTPPPKVAPAPPLKEGETPPPPPPPAPTQLNRKEEFDFLAELDQQIAELQVGIY